MNTIQSAWENFEKKVLDPIDAGEVQRAEMKKAFYAGVYTQLMNNLVASECSEDAAIAMINGWVEEVAAFSELVKAGKA